MLEELKRRVLDCNLELPRSGLVRLTWGNVSGSDAASGLVVIKASGVPYATMTVDDMVVVDSRGVVVEGERRPSTDLLTHLALYAGLPGVGGIVHTHSTWAAAWAQALQPIPLLGTTHADFSPVAVPVTPMISPDQVSQGYEEQTGRLILATLAGRPAAELPGVLVGGHGPFCWGLTPEKAVESAVTLEEVAKMAWLTTVLRPESMPLAQHVVERHFTRKHGPGAYYGQASP